MCCCGQHPKNNGTAQSETRTPGKSFAPPPIPATLADDASRRNYLLSHYWESFDFADTLMLKPEIAEQALANFLNIALQSPSDKAGEAISKLMAASSADSTAFAYFIELTERYLYDPNSPYRSEELYIPVLRYLVASPKLNEYEKIRPQYQLDMAMKNRPGSVAADFTYTQPNGSRGRLSGLHAECTLLYFYNPDCPDCKRVREYLCASPVFAAATERGLRVLALYPDEELDLWRKHLAEIPKKWVVGHALLRGENPLYDLRAIPNLYLLDKEKRVILKDAPVEQIEAWLVQSM